MYVYIYTIYILTTKRLWVVGLQAMEKCLNSPREADSVGAQRCVLPSSNVASLPLNLYVLR